MTKLMKVVTSMLACVVQTTHAGPVEVDRTALARELPKQELVSVRVDPSLEVGGKPAGRPRREAPDALAFRRGREEPGRVVGDPARLDLLVEVVGGRTVDDVSALLLPRDLGAFERRAEDRRHDVAELLREGREKVERVERLVCALYGLTDELTAAVVEHAVKRAGGSGPSD